MKEILKGKKILIVDDEKDVLDVLLDMLDISKVDVASNFDDAKDLILSNDYDIAVLDIMGVKGYDLLKLTTNKKIPTLMLTAHALTKEDLKKSIEEGASYYVPKDKIENIDVFVADVLEAKEKKKNPVRKCFERLESYYDKRFGGRDWRDKEQEFWKKKLDEIPDI